MRARVRGRKRQLKREFKGEHLRDEQAEYGILTLLLYLLSTVNHASWAAAQTSAQWHPPRHPADESPARIAGRP